MLKDLKAIAFDADETAWVNESYFRETEEKFSKLLTDFLPKHTVDRVLLMR
jgi:putative hydrolase of the HAD superfamily